MLAQALQVGRVIPTFVLLRNDMINVDISLANFLAALGAGVPAVIGFVFREPIFSVAQKIFLQIFFRDYTKIFKPCKPAGCEKEKYVLDILLNWDYYNARDSARRRASLNFLWEADFYDKATWRQSNC